MLPDSLNALLSPLPEYVARIVTLKLWKGTNSLTVHLSTHSIPILCTNLLLHPPTYTCKFLLGCTFELVSVNSINYTHVQHTPNTIYGGGKVQKKDFFLENRLK